MSAWLIGLGLSAGYLINKNMTFRTQLENSVSEFQSASKPATGGVTSSEVRTALKRTDHVKYGDMNTDLPRNQMDQLHEQQQLAASQVEKFDVGVDPPASIQGVLLHYDHLGV